MSIPAKTTVAAILAAAILGVSGTASAAQLNLGYETTASGTVINSMTPNAPDTANIFGSSFTKPTTTVTGSGSPGDGFYDGFLFTVPDASIDSVTTTIDLNHVSQINNLQVRLFDLSLNPTPNEPNPLNGPVINASWTQVSIPGTGMETVDVLPATMLTAGTYVLEVRGNVVGTGGGAYSGTLNMSPVPVPAAFSLLLSGLGVLGGAIRRSRA
jgi:hypothetical protein